MPRPASPPRLYLRPDLKIWIIRDKGRDIRTGCSERESERAQIRLADYLTQKHAARPPVGGKSSAIPIAEVLNAYVLERAPNVAKPSLIHDHISALKPFWALRKVAEIKGTTCRAYATSRTTLSMARHELETLRAAVNHFHREYGLDPVPAFTMPEKHGSRERWLTRQEAANLLRACRGLPHLRRFVLIGLYTGTRSGAILALSWMPSVNSGWLDLDKGILFRAGSSQRKTNKRQPPVKLSPRLAAHLARWKRMDGGMRHIIHWNDSSVQSVKKAFKSACRQAGLGWYVERKGKDGKPMQAFKTDVIPHTLRHTSATWLMQAGVTTWEAAGFLGMTEKVLEDNYGHHSPSFQNGAATAIGSKRA